MTMFGLVSDHWGQFFTVVLASVAVACAIVDKIVSLFKGMTNDGF